jgi:hypothetical protein
MTIERLKRLPEGTMVVWREGLKSPQPGELTDRGIVHVLPGGRRQIAWRDGQFTEQDDDWALVQVEEVH